MDSAVAGLVAGIGDLIVKDDSFVCSANFENIAYDTNLEVVNGKLQLKSVVHDTYSRLTGSTGSSLDKYYATRHKAPGEAGCYIKIKSLTVYVYSYASQNMRIQIRADNNGTPGAVLAESEDISSEKFFENKTATFNYEGITGGQYFWVCARGMGSTTFASYMTTTPFVEQGEDLGNAKISADGTTWTTPADQYSARFEVTFDVIPLSGSYSKDIVVNSVVQWKTLYGQDPITPANTSHVLVIKDIANNVLIASAADPQSLAGISENYRVIRLNGTLSREVAAGTATPSISPFTVEFANNVCIPTQWANKSFTTNAPTGSHEANTILDITWGSGYVATLGGYSGGSTRNYGIQIDGGPIYKISTDDSIMTLFPLRFNGSCKITCSVAGGQTNFGMVVLD